MPIFRLPVEPLFPDPSWANPDGLLAVGGDLSTPRLLVAYRNGIYPWFSEGQPILWWSPNPRMVLALADLHVPRSLRRTLRKRAFNVTVDVAFRDVVAACQGVERPGQHGTWITADMVEAYVRLHEAGAAHSVEAWDMNGNLVGGLYGVSIGRMFAGESMFTHTPDASKVAFITMALQLRQ
jgi:leucyl/phenylalanyl-tRNA--protein transferase